MTSKRGSAMHLSKRSSLSALAVAGLTWLAALSPSFAQDAVSLQKPAVGVIRVKPKAVVKFKLNLSKKSAATRFLYVFNKGKADLHVKFGDASAPFDVACSCRNDTIHPGGSVRAVMAFQPKQAGTYSEDFAIDSDTGKGKTHIVLTLKGVATGALPTSTASVSGEVSVAGSPMAGATVNLYAAGEDPDGSDTSLISSARSDAKGRFQFAKVHCSNPDALVYAVSSGGSNPGCSTENKSLALMTALGTCADLGDSHPIIVNELTTAAAALSLAPYISKATPHQVAGDSNQVANAFAEAERLVDSRSGAIMASGASTEGSIAPIGNALAVCARCGDSADCSSVLSCSAPGSVFQGGTCVGGSSAITDTLQAALSIAGNPPDDSVVLEVSR
jgi:hypothetical protein